MQNLQQRRGQSTHKTPVQPLIGGAVFYHSYFSDEMNPPRVIPSYFSDEMDSPRVIPLSVALVSRHGVRPPSLSGTGIRLVREPHEIHPNDDVVLFYGPGMAQDLRRYSAEAKGELPPALILAPWLDWDDVCLALDNGAASYLLENRFAHLLAEALLYTSRGGSILDPTVAAEQIRVATWARAGAREPAVVAADPTGDGDCSGDSTPQFRLSPREGEIMRLLASGLAVREVARDMCLTEKTVRNYLSRIYGKLNVRSRSEAILCWLGLLDVPPDHSTGPGR
jgi:DNA-binding NarL/FixJ family response regulator